jgi:hypothetical protein
MEKDGYDFVEMLKRQFVHFPRGGFGMDDILDAQAYQEDLLIPRPMHTGPTVDMGKKALPNDVIRDTPEGEPQKKGLYVPKHFAGRTGHMGRWVPGRFKNA